MIQKFSNRVLDGLGREYGVIGSISRTDSLEISPPVLVHDVSENVRAMSWIPVAAQIDIDTLALSSSVWEELTRAQFLATAPVAAVLALLRLAPAEVDIWPFHWHGSVTAATAANFASAAVGVRMAQAPAETSIVVPLAVYAVADPSGVLIEGSVQPLAEYVYDQKMERPRPFLLSDHGPSAFLGKATSDAGGGTVVSLMVHCYIGPKGSIPPGV